jgi:hypothetical protein
MPVPKNQSPNVMTNLAGGDSDPSPADRRSLVRLVRELVNDATLLVRQEIAFARAELVSNLQSVFKRFGQVAFGVAIALLGLLVFVFFLVLGLGALLGGNYWLSALLISLLLIGAGGGLAYLGIRRASTQSVTPDEALESVKETQKWLAKEVGELRASLAKNERPSLTSGDERKPLLNPPAAGSQISSERKA